MRFRPASSIFITRFQVLLLVLFALVYANFILLYHTLINKDNDNVPKINVDNGNKLTTTLPVLITIPTASPAQQQQYIYRGSELPNINSKLLFIGVFTIAQNHHRRLLLRESFRGFNNEKASLVFVIGKPATIEISTQLQQEELKYKDIMILPCEENMNEGKTLHFFRQVGLMYPPHQFYLKIDDDTFLNIPDAISTIESHQPRNKPLYYGRAAGYYYKNFRVGWCYGMSANLLARIPDPPLNITGHEDRVAQGWVRQTQSLGLLVNEVHDKDGLYMYEHSPKKWGNWQRPFSHNRTVAIHPFKDDEDYLKAVEFYQGKLLKEKLEKL